MLNWIIWSYLGGFYQRWYSLQGLQGGELEGLQDLTGPRPQGTSL